jgi:uncharacterized phage-associated protein
MPAAKDKKRSAALRQIWTRLREYLAAEMARAPSTEEFWARIEKHVERAAEEGKEAGPTHRPI